MAEHLELWTEKTPAPRDLFDRAPAFGVAAEVDRAPDDLPVEHTTSEPPTPRRERGPFVTYLCMPWSYGDREPGERWRRMRCRLGRHRTVGGYTMQVDSAVVYIERQCQWCGTGIGGG